MEFLHVGSVMIHGNPSYHFMWYQANYDNYYQMVIYIVHVDWTAAKYDAKDCR